MGLPADQYFIQDSDGNWDEVVYDDVAAIAADPDATILAGGTLLMSQLALGYTTVDRAVWLGKAGLDEVNETGGRVTIGGMATLAT